MANPCSCHASLPDALAQDAARRTGPALQPSPLGSSAVRKPSVAASLEDGPSVGRSGRTMEPMDEYAEEDDIGRGETRSVAQGMDHEEDEYEY